MSERDNNSLKDTNSFGLLDLDFRVRILRIRGEAVAGFRQRFCVFIQKAVRNAQGF